MYKTILSVVRYFHGKKTTCGGSPGTATPLPPQRNPARQAFYVIRNRKFQRNFLLQKNTACQAVFTALTSGFELLNIVISNKLVGFFVVVVIDGIHLIQQGFFIQAAAGAQGFQRIVIIPKLGIYVTKQNHRIFWYHKIGSPLRFITVHTCTATFSSSYFTFTTYSPFSRSNTSVSPVWTSPERILRAVSVSTYFWR